MITREQLYEGLRRADANGDREGVVRLAAYLKGLPPEPAPARSLAESRAQPLTPEDPLRATQPDLAERAAAALKKTRGLVSRAVVQGAPAAVLSAPALISDAYDSLVNLTSMGANAALEAAGSETRLPVGEPFRASRAVTDLGIDLADGVRER